MPFYKKGQRGISRSKKLEILVQKNGLRHAIFNTAGDKYIGEWKENKRSGKGASLTNKNKDLYEGDFENDVRQGFGVAAHKLPNINVFELKYRGFWKNGKRHGHGIRVFISGGFFIGDFIEGKRDGYGQMWYPDGCYYDGYWSKDKRHGLGLLVYKNGNKYDGSWVNDMKHGKGVLYFLNVGQLQQGIWRENICVFSTITMLPFRQSAIHPTIFPLPRNHLVDMDEICEIQEEKALKGVSEKCLTLEDDVITVSDSTNTKKNESIN